MVTEVNPIRNRGFQCLVTTEKLIVPSRHRNNKKNVQITMKYLTIAIIRGGIVSPPSSSDTNHLPRGQLPPQISVATIRSMYDLSTFCFSMFWVLFKEGQLFYWKNQEIFVFNSSEKDVLINEFSKIMRVSRLLCYSVLIFLL